MLRSMTGFGKGSSENRHTIVKIEIKSLNYKFFEMANRMPANMTIFEDKVRNYLQKKISRGRLNLFLTYDTVAGKRENFHIDKDIAAQYLRMIKQTKKALGIKGDITIDQLLSLPGVVVCNTRQDDVESMWPLIARALSQATEDLIVSKREEGAMLKKDLQKIVKQIEVSLARIKNRAPAVVKEYKSRLFQNVKGLNGTRRILNPERMEEEAAIFARNCDIAEEVQRITSHVVGFKKALSNHGEVGRRLDFIAQEIYREVNTVGAKANDFSIAKEVIKIKSLVEKIREQVQNVE